MVNILVFVITSAIMVGIALVALAKRDKDHAAVLAAKDAYLDTLGAQVKDTEKKLQAFLNEGKKISSLGSKSIADTEFLNKISRTAEDADMAFLIDAVHRGIYEAILTAPTDALILNAAGKGKGIRMLENTLRNPASIFGGAE